jgi:hypothetical protein
MATQRYVTGQLLFLLIRFFSIFVLDKPDGTYNEVSRPLRVVDLRASWVPRQRSPGGPFAISDSFGPILRVNVISSQEKEADGLEFALSGFNWQPIRIGAGCFRPTNKESKRQNKKLLLFTYLTNI